MSDDLTERLADIYASRWEHGWHNSSEDEREGKALREAFVAAIADARQFCDGSCDIALARRQVGPDGVVPGNARECAELWEREASRLRIALAAERTAREQAEQEHKHAVYVGDELVVQRDAAERRAEQAEQNERLVMERLSKALTGGNAATWDEVCDAADEVFDAAEHAEQERDRLRGILHELAAEAELPITDYGLLRDALIADIRTARRSRAALASQDGQPEGTTP
jgi:hypothetical protein